MLLLERIISKMHIETIFLKNFVNYLMREFNCYNFKLIWWETKAGEETDQEVLIPATMPVVQGIAVTPTRVVLMNFHKLSWGVRIVQTKT